MKLLKQYGTDPVWSGLTFQGPDASLETSLLEYHIVWALASDGDYKFVYRVPSHMWSTSVLATDWASYPANTDVQKEWDWVNFADVAHAHDTVLDDWLNRPFPQKVFNLVNVYGHENIFGSSTNPRRDRVYDDLVWLATTDEAYVTDYCDLVLTVGPTTFSVGDEKFTFEGKFAKGAAAAIAHADVVLARRYEVIVGNVGRVYDGNDKEVAMHVYQEYVEISKAGVGRAGGEPVTLTLDGEIIHEHTDS